MTIPRGGRRLEMKRIALCVIFFSLCQAAFGTETKFWRDVTETSGNRRIEWDAFSRIAAESGGEKGGKNDPPLPAGRFVAAAEQTDGFSTRRWIFGLESDGKSEAASDMARRVIVYSIADGESAWRRSESMSAEACRDFGVPIEAVPFGATAILLFGEPSNGRTPVAALNTTLNHWSLMEPLPTAAAKILRLSDRIAVETAAGEVRFFAVDSPARFGTLNYIVLAVYMAGMLGLGFLFMRGNRNVETFYLGGGQLPWWALGISLFATMLSAITFLSMPAKAFATNWSMFVFNLGILLAAPIVIRFYLPRFRRMDAVSAYEYFEKRFNAATRLFASGLFSVFMVTRIAVVLYLPALALNTATGMDVRFCILATGLVTLLYSTLGGMKAVVWGDVIQGIILVGGAFLTLLWLFLHIDGGVAGFLREAAPLGKLDAFDWAFDWTRPTFWVVLFGGLAGNLISYTSDQTIVQRYMSADGQRTAIRSVWLNAILTIPITVTFFLIGSGLFVYYKTHPGLLSPALDKLDAIYPYYIVTALPPGAAGLLTAAIFAAAMSTLSSNINSASAAILSDFVRLVRPKMSSTEEIAAGRAAGIAVGIAGIGTALLLAAGDIQSLWDQFNTFLGLFTGTLGALFFIGFFIPAIDGRGALCGVIGAVAAMFVLSAATDLSFLLYGLIEMILCVLIGGAVSALCGRKDIVN